MDKPVTLLRQELIDNIANIINSSGLPPVIVVPILKDMLSESQAALQRQYIYEKSQYEASIKNTENDE